jgi:hypothetical protein
MVSRQPAVPLPFAARAPEYVRLNEASLPFESLSLEYLLAGKVADLQGEALSGAQVSLRATIPGSEGFDSSPAMMEQSTDGAGLFSMRLNSAAHAYIVIRMAGFAEVYEEINFSEPGIMTKNYRLRPAPTCAEGSVLDKHGNAIPGAEVSIWLLPAKVATSLDSTSLSPIAGTTDRLGKYEIRGIPEGNGSISVKAPGYLSDILTYYPKIGPCGKVDFCLTRALSISFAVRNERGDMVPKAEARALGESTSANDKGVVKFDLPPDMQPFQCTVAAEGFKPLSILLNPDSPPAALVLEAAESKQDSLIRGHVATEANEDVWGAKVALRDGGNAHWEVAVSDSSGRFTVSPANKNPIALSIRKPGFQEARIDLTEAKPRGLGVEVRLKRAEAGIYGRVIDDLDNPIPRFRVTFVPDTLRDRTLQREDLSSLLPLMPYIRDIQNDAGLFSVTDIPAGVYSIRIQSLPYSPQEQARSISLGRVEIRRGYMYGEVIGQLPPPGAGK